MHWEGRVKFVKNMRQWINELRVPAGASEEQIQEALSKLFQQSQKVTDSVDRDQRGQDQIKLEQRIREQYQTERAEQTRSTTTDNSVQSILYSIKEDQDQVSVQFCSRSSSFVGSESNCNITTRFEAAD